jgi:AcrR family transcriptional regulator
VNKSKGRPKEFDEEQALELAMHYFWANGYDGSSLRDLLIAMGIGKSSFYQTFGCKEDLFRRSLELYTQSSVEYIRSLLAEKTSKEVLLYLPQTLLEELKETGKTKGCLLMNSGAECYKLHPQISDLIEYEYKTFLELFAELIASAKVSGDISDTTSDSALASIYSSLLNGLIAVIQAGASEQQIEAVMGHIEQVLR